MAQDWITLTLDDVAAAVTPQDIKSHRQLAKKQDSTDPVLDVLTGVTDDIRGYVKGNPQNTLGQPGTIPRELRDTALVLIKSRMPVGAKLDEAGQKDLDRALGKLKSVARGEFKVEPPTNPLATQSLPGSLMQTVRRGRHHRHEDVDLRGF